MRTATWWSASIIALVAASGVCRASDETYDRTLAVQPKGTVDISNINGTTRVDGWDLPEVSVHADLGSGVEKVEVNTEGTRTSIRVIPHQRRAPRGQDSEGQ